MVEAPDAVLRLIAGIDGYLAAGDADCDGVAGARRELACVRRAGTQGAPAGNRGGTIHDDDFGLGLFVMAPRTFYRDHCDRAPELYAPLAGPHQWRFERGPWSSRPAYQPVWNEPMTVHATLSGDVPFPCVYIWTRDIGAPAVLVGAPDRAEIESRL